MAARETADNNAEISTNMRRGLTASACVDDEEEDGRIELRPLVLQQQRNHPAPGASQLRSAPSSMESSMNAECDPCRICNIIKPLRAKHCFTCGRCVRRFDHHCPYLGQCVGERNHGVFYIMLVMHLSLAILCAAVLFPLLQGQATFAQMLSHDWLVSALHISGDYFITVNRCY